MVSLWSRTHICQCLTRLLAFRRNKVVTVVGSRRKTGKQLVESALNIAREISDFGLSAGDVVAICAFNSDWYLEWMLAVTYVGGIIAPLNYRWSFDESKAALEVIRPVMIVTDESCTWSSELQNIGVCAPRWHASVDCYSSAAKSMENVIDRCHPLSIKYWWAPEDAAVICFTSGTTGRPKGVTISHTSLMMQCLAKIAIVGYTEDDVYLHTAPMCHIGAISSCMAMLMAGGCHILTSKFVAEIAIKAIREYHVTSLITVPTILADLMSTIRQTKTQEPSLKKILNGGGSLSAQLIRDAMTCFPCAKLLSAYGMTETCSSLTFMTLNDQVGNKAQQHLERTDKLNIIGGICVGKAAPHVEILISKEDASHVGRIMTRGPHVMIRYWGQTTTAVTDSGEDWFDTGDIGQFDAVGNLWLVGRRNGLIKTGGENVYPEEVEAVISQHPGVSSVVVTGIPTARLGEMVVACVQIRGNWMWADSVDDSPRSIKPCLSNKLLKEHCQQKYLTGFKIPKVFVVWRRPFPLTSTGKLKRDQIKMEAIMELQPLLCNL